MKTLIAAAALFAAVVSPAMANEPPVTDAATCLAMVEPQYRGLLCAPDVLTIIAKIRANGWNPETGCSLDVSDSKVTARSNLCLIALMVIEKHPTPTVPKPTVLRGGQ